MMKSRMSHGEAGPLRFESASALEPPQLSEAEEKELSDARDQIRRGEWIEAEVLLREIRRTSRS